MKHFLRYFFLLGAMTTFSQVGIGTALPDASSLLDMKSTTQGMLAPRMTTAQRIAIPSPANGLLVYDTSLSSFFVFEATVWESMKSINKRTKYKLVQSIADLSEELAGGVYTLKTDFLYEINGTILVDAPINLNGAYIEGVDVGSDILVNNSTSALFAGATAGSMRNLTISGNGKQVFNIVGSGAGTLVVNNTAFIGASSIGVISDIGTVFFSITQYVGNTTGFTMSNLGTLLMSNTFWTTSNTGTFLKLSGTFNNVQLATGRIENEGTEVGVDVSANPVINNDGTLSQLSFVGNGVPVKRYTTGSYTDYNFTKDWNVNCSGILLETDQAAAANFYFNNGTLTTGFTQTITNGTAVQIKNATDFFATGLFRFRAADNNNDVIYEGKKKRNVQVNVSLSARVTGAAGDFYAFAIAKEGVIVAETSSIVQITSDTQIQNIALNGVISISPNERIEIFVRRLTGTGNDTLVIFSENLSVR